MRVISSTFALFVPLVLAVYYWLPRRPQNRWLLLASYIFVATWSIEFALVLLTLTAASFALGLRLGGEGRGRRTALWLGIGLNVLTLAFFRAGGFFIDEFVRLLGRLGLTTAPGALQILLPVGLAYSVLQNISYLVDVYRGQLLPARSFVDFALYLAYFPKFLAGPIERARSFLPKLEQPRVVDDAQIARSLTRLLVGAARKLLIADTLLAAIPVHIWEAPGSISALELWLWLGVYGIYLYNDFAGYTSLMRGVSGLFGIELSPNFDAPYFARSFSEFWNRWHISLSHWLRDYIYYPFSRGLLSRLPSRDNLANYFLPPLATMLVSGLWHGFTSHMLVWGGLHGLFLAAEQLPRRWRRVAPPDEWPWWRQALGMVAVALMVNVAWVAFRLELPEALQFWAALASPTGLGIMHRRLFIALAIGAISLAIDWVQARRRDEFVFLRWPRLAQAGLAGLVIFAVWIVTATDVQTPFVYRGF